MKQIGFLLLAALASKGALAGEVGAPFPQLANSTAVLAVAIAETGASSSLALNEPMKTDVTAAQQATLNDYVEDAIEQISGDLEQRILRSLEQQRYAVR